MKGKILVKKIIGKIARVTGDSPEKWEDVAALLGYGYRDFTSRAGAKAALSATGLVVGFKAPTVVKQMGRGDDWVCYPVGLKPTPLSKRVAEAMIKMGPPKRSDHPGFTAAIEGFNPPAAWARTPAALMMWLALERREGRRPSAGDRCLQADAWLKAGAPQWVYHHPSKDQRCDIGSP